MNEVDLSWLEDFQRKYGGWVTKAGKGLPGHKKRFTSWLTSSDAIRILKKVRPYLKLKSEQAGLCFELQKRIDPKLGMVGNRLTKEEKAIREDERGVRTKQLPMELPDKPEVEQPQLL